MQKRRKITINKLIKLLIKNRYFLLVISVLVLLPLSCFNRKIGFLLAVLLLLAYIFIPERPKGISVLEFILVLFMVILIGLGPNYMKMELSRWSNKFYDANIEEIQVPTPWGPLIIRIAQTPPQLKEMKISEIKILPEEKDRKKAEITNIETAALIASSLARQKLENNLVNNGDFNIPLTSNLSKWGHGLYSDIIQRQRPELNFTWINFLNADIDVLIEKTEIGHALKITHKSETIPHKVGIMEQRIKVTPGLYALSCLAKALDDCEEGALWIATNDEWIAPLTTNQKGPFDWQPFSQNVKIDKADLITLTVISQGKGTLYLSNITLVKISDKSLPQK